MTNKIFLKKKEKNIKTPLLSEPKIIDKDLKKEHQKIKKQFEQTEEKIALLNKQKISLEAALASPDIYSDKNKFVQAENDYSSVSSKLEKMNGEYEVIFEKLMEMENKMG